MPRIAAAAVIALVMTAVDNSALSAQLPVDKALSKIEDFSIYPLIPLTKSRDSYFVVGTGLEFSFLIGSRTRPMKLRELRNRCEEINEEKGVPLDTTVPPGCNQKRSADTTRKLTEVRVRTGRLADSVSRLLARARLDSALKSPTDTAKTDFKKVIDSLTKRLTLLQKDAGDRVIDSVFTFTIDKDAYTVTTVQFEIAVATQQTRLRHTPADNRWRLSGTVTEFPVLSMYATFRPDKEFSPYVGVRYANAKLTDLRIQHGDTVSKLETTSIGVGAALGVAAEVMFFSPYAEVSYTYMKFNTTNWTLPTTLTGTPANYPKNLDFIGTRLSIGVQVPLGGAK